MTKYMQGKEDAFYEVIKLLQGFKLARDIKHVPITQFYQAIQQKLNDLRTPKGGSQTCSSVSTKRQDNQ